MKKLRVVAAALMIAAILTLIAGLGTLRAPDRYLNDALYQQPSAISGKVVIIGFDRKALERYGQLQTWDREKLAELITVLNASENDRPRAIAIDVYFGGGTNPETDAALAEAAALAGNVICASMAEFGSDLVETDGVFVRKKYALLGFEEPYPALREVTRQGHINAMKDTDGVLRHHMLYLDLEDGTRVPSLALCLAKSLREDLTEPVTDSRGFWYLSFFRKPGDFEEVSLADVLDGTIPASYFRGKLVLVGPYAAGLQDSFVTAMDRAALMYGVEYQANAVEALLAEEYKREIGDGPQLAVLFILLTAAFLAFWKRKVAFSTSVWLVLSGGWVLLCKLLFDGGWVLHVLWVPAGLTVLYAGCLAANYLQAALERQRVTGTFRRYVAPEIVSQLLEAGPEALKLGGKKCDIAVLFVDIRGFTSMSEALEPERVVEILNEYLTLTTKSVMDNQGTLDKFVGDCTMAIWNAPLPQEDYVMLACRAAMDMVEGAKPLSERLQKEFGRTVSFGIGVHAGPAVVGNIGAPMRMDYTAIGDTVNTAARLEANAPGSHIYISRAVADALEGRIRATPLDDPPLLKGKTEGFEILTLDAIL